MKKEILQRCPWVGQNKPHYELYHDTQWGIAVHDDCIHFEMLSLEGAQAGLSWETILNRRENYREVFKQFDPAACANLSDSYLEDLLTNPKIIRNRLKVFSVRQNARIFITIQKEYGSFDAYVWSFVNNKTIINRPQTLQDLLTTSQEAKDLSIDLKKRGMSFVGATIIYAYMQAVGLVDDHFKGCFRAKS